MDPRGLRARLTGAGCTSCGAAIPVDRIAVLAGWRGDLRSLLVGRSVDDPGPDARA